MNTEELQRLRSFQLTLAHHSDLYQIIEQRALSLTQYKFHWFVRLQSLLFVAEQVTRDNATREEAEFVAFKLKNALVLLINENKPNYVSPLSALILHCFKTAPAAIYDVYTPFLFYLQQNCSMDFVGVFAYFPVDGAALAEVLERAEPDQANAVLTNVGGFCAANGGFTDHLLTGASNSDVNRIIVQFNPPNERVEQPEQPVLDDGQTVMLLRQAQHLIGYDEGQGTGSAENGIRSSVVAVQDEYRPYNAMSASAIAYNDALVRENQALRRRAAEYEETLRQLSYDAPYSQVYQLQLEAAQTRYAFDQLMIKYQSYKQYIAELQQRTAQYQEKLAQFKVLFEQANQRYEEMKRVANERIQELRQGRGDTGELAAARAEIEKLRSEKAQLSDITKKLITKLNSK